MKYFINFVFGCFFSLGFAQKDTILHQHKFPNGKTSTICVLKDDREGYAKAYDFSGKEIYHSYIRRFGGHASVSFKHHANGMVREAHYSSHPDGGIQWYNTWTTFDEQGNKTGERHNNWDDRVTVPTHMIHDTILFKHTHAPNPIIKPDVQTPIKPKPKTNPVQPKKEVVECASIHQNRTYFINHSKSSILLSVSYKGKDTLIVLKPKKTFEGPTYISAQISSPIKQNVQYKFNSKKKNQVVDSVIEAVKTSELETVYRVHFYSRRKEKH